MNIFEIDAESFYSGFTEPEAYGWDERRDYGWGEPKEETPWQYCPKCNHEYNQKEFQEQSHNNGRCNEVTAQKIETARLTAEAAMGKLKKIEINIKTIEKP